MSGYNSNNYSDSDDFERSDNSGGGLRKQLEDTLAELKRLKADRENEQRGKTVTELLQGKGFDPAVAELMPSDADPAEWVDKYSKFLGPQVAEQMEDRPATEPDVEIAADTDPAVLAERAALASQSDAAESGYPAITANELLNKIQNSDSEAEFMKLLKENGAMAD